MVTTFRSFIAWSDKVGELLFHASKLADAEPGSRQGTHRSSRFLVLVSCFLVHREFLRELRVLRGDDCDLIF